jgi:hypothetical protein
MNREIEPRIPARRIIALCGPKGSGKTLLADYLVTHYGAQRRSFASPIRRALQAMGCPTRFLAPDADKTAPIPEMGGRSARHLLQTLDTEWGRNMVSEDIWIQADAATLPRTGLYVYDDLRMPNEARHLRDLRATIVKVIGGMARCEDAHETEQGWKSISPDLMVLNILCGPEALQNWLQTVALEIMCLAHGVSRLPLAFQAS